MSRNQDRGSRFLSVATLVLIGVLVIPAAPAAPQDSDSWEEKSSDSGAGSTRAAPGSSSKQGAASGSGSSTAAPNAVLPVPGSSVSKEQLKEFALGGPLPQRLNDAASDLRNKTSGGEATVNGIVNRGTVVEVKGADGSTKLFRVRHPLTEFHDHTFGRVPQDGSVSDSSRVVVDPVGPGEKIDPDAPRIVVSDRQTTGEIALELSRQAGRTLSKQNEEARLDRAIRADQRTRIQSQRPKVRDEFVNRTISEAADVAARDIERKQDLERQGATISTKLPFESEHHDAFKRAFAAELAKSGDPKAALAAANAAGRRAVEDAVRRDKSVADRAGKAFDQRFEQFAREHPDQLTEAERQHRTDELIKGLAELVNKVDPNSPEADKVIELVDAIVPQLSGADQIKFINAADRGLERLLGNFGFRIVEGSGGARVVDGREVGNLQLDRLDYALGNFDALTPKERDEVKRSPVAAARHGIRLGPTAAEIRSRDRIKAIRTLPDGTLHEGTLAEFREAAEQNRINHILGQLEAIANAGPGALLGRIIDGERGAAIGAAIDAGLPIIASVKARANVRAGIESFPSGGHVVTGGPGGAEFEPVSGPGVSGSDRLVPVPRTNVGEVGGDLVRRPERPRQVTQSPSNGNPPAQNPTGGKTGRQSDQVAQRSQRQQTAQTGDFTADEQKEKDRLEQVEQQRRDDQRFEEEARRDLEQASRRPPSPGDGKSVSVDRALDRLEKGDPTILESHSSKFHRFVFEKALNQKLGPGKEPPVAFTVGDGVRIDVERLDPKQRERFLSIVRAERARRAGNTQNPPKQSPPGTGQQASRSEAPTGKIVALRPEVAIEAAEPDGIPPGKFTSKDVTFGLARVKNNPNALVEFSGQAEPGTSLKLDEAEREGGTSSAQRAPARFNSLERGEQVAAKTIALTKERLRTSGGKLRFSLAGFSVEQALNPKAENFKQITSFEFRGVLSDPFFSRRVHFFDKDGKDVTRKTIEQAKRILAGLKAKR